MNKIISVVIIIFLALTLTSCESVVYNENELISLAKSQVSDMLGGDFSSTVESFNSDMEKALNEETLQQLWNETTAEIGMHIGNYSVESGNVDGYFVVTVVEEYEHNGFEIRFVYENDNKIAGIYFNYSTIETTPVVNETFEEIPVTIGEEFPLEGILTLPVSVENPPVVLLVHGSGSTDKNSTIYANTPFKDIAHGLANQGIAALRYDKRYFTYPEKAAELGADLTLEDEVLEDVQLALNLLLEDERIDNSNIFVLGHSLGGGLTPYIAYSNENVKGIISMAGSPRPLYEISYDQNKAIEDMILNGDFDDATKTLLKSQMVQVEKDIETLRGDLTEVENEVILLGLYAGYQKSTKEFAGENFIDEINVPILVLQGSADFQVYADKDYLLWESALAGRDNVTFKLYDGLNHLMMESNGKQDITEYEIKGNVATEVIDDIADFVK